MRKVLRPFLGMYSLEDINKQVELSFPFDNFFPGQKETIVKIVDALLNSGKHHVILEAPTGSGKTLIAWTVHRTIDKLIGNERLKTTVTTSTKGLQKQYVDDCKTYNLMGKTNYPCPMGAKNYGTIDCKHKVAQKQCKPKAMCPYVSTRLNWTETMTWRSTNSSMFIEMCPMLVMEESNKADFVVLDESHKLPDTLLDHTEVSFNVNELKPVDAFAGGTHLITVLATMIERFLRKEFKEGDIGKQVLFPADKAVVINTRELLHSKETIINWAFDEGYIRNPADLVNNPIVRAPLVSLIGFLNVELNKFLDHITSRLKETENLDLSIKDACERVILSVQDWSDTCELITDCGIRDFILQTYDTKAIGFKPMLASDVSHYGIFRKGDYFLHMSATICGLRAYAQEMGIPSGDYVTVEAPHPIELDRRPVNYIPQVRMGGAYTPDKGKEMAKNIAMLAEHHNGENGLIHTASYKLAEEILSYLPPEIKQRSFIGKDREKTLMQLKMNKGVICLSPSMEEGYDLKHDIARWQVIAKVPYGYLGDPSIKFKSEKYEGSYYRAAVLRIVQASGRVVRGCDDYGTTYILDSSFERLLANGDQFFPEWWTDALRGF